ncbi:hypothetical protein BJ138DRAFT_1200450, partial [Hygrophoropsis aurantiaca]
IYLLAAIQVASSQFVCLANRDNNDINCDSSSNGRDSRDCGTSSNAFTSLGDDDSYLDDLFYYANIFTSLFVKAVVLWIVWDHSPMDDTPTGSEPDAKDATRDENDDARLPLPGKRDAEGELAVRHMDIRNLKREALRDLCKELGIPHSATMPVLKERLRKFSSQQNQWDDLLPGAGAKRSHKGPQPNAKRRQAKISHLRREHLLERTSAGDGSAVVTHTLPTERSKDTRTPEEIASVIPWAKAFVANNPYQPPRLLFTPPPSAPDSPGNGTSTPANAMDVEPAQSLVLQ